MALVTITTDERIYTQSYIFNRSYQPDGSIVEAWGTSSRTVTESTVTYRGDKASVRAQITAAQLLGKETVIRKIDGPWWEGVATETSYGEWQTVIEQPDEEEVTP